MSSVPGPTVVVPHARTVDELPSPGLLAAAPVVPAAGPILEAEGSPVVVVVQKFWDSPTIKTIRAIVLMAAGVGAGYIGERIVANGGISGLDWHDVGRAALDVAIVSFVAAVFAWRKKTDNNPVR